MTGLNSAASTPNRRERAHHHGDRMQGEAGRRDGGRADLGELDPPGDLRLVEPVRQFAGEAGEEEERRHEQRARDLNQRAAAGLRRRAE